MTEEQIVKALECSPLDDIGGCRKIDALDLINRQKAEIERLKEMFNEGIRVYDGNCTVKDVLHNIDSLVEEMVGE